MRYPHRSIPLVALLLHTLIVTSLPAGALAAADHPPAWQPLKPAGLALERQPDGASRVVSPAAGEFIVDSIASLPAKTGACFEIELRLKAGIDMSAQPELACFDAQGREIPPPPAGAPANRPNTTNWQTFARTFVALPGTASVRARVRGFGRGSILLDGLALRPTEIDTYETGALMARPNPRTRTGVLLESNFGIVNRDSISTADRDGDGKWALVTVNLDELTAPEKKGDDWRSSFEDNPNVILWTDGAVLKSDSMPADRAPDVKRALHFRTKVHAGPYAAWAGDPGRPVAVSLDGKTWQRHEGGAEIELGILPLSDGVVELWIDACYADPLKTGPAYFDYVRLMPVAHAPDTGRLFAAARNQPARLTRGSTEETSVAVTLEAPAFSAAKAWPVRCGLPVPRGELVSAENIGVRDGSGRPVPCQGRITATWPDGSAKWIFLDFMHELSRGAKADYTVAYGNAVRSMPSAATVRLARGADGIEVDTGAIRFLVSGARFGMIEDVQLASGERVQRAPINAEIVEAGGRVWSALEQPVARLAVEQAGPLHAVILVETKLAESGQPSEGFYHRARIHAYAGSPLVEVDYFVANTDSRPAKDVGGSMASKVAIASLALKLRPDFAITGARHALGAAGATGAIVQQSGEDALVRTGETVRELRARLPGWLALGTRPVPAAAETAAAGGGRGPGLHVGLAAVRVQFPMALRWTPRELTIDLWAAEGDPFEWFEGVGKTHRLALLYARADPADGSLLAAGPVLATASPGWYVRSGALGEIVTAAESGMPAVEKSLSAHMRNPVIDGVGLGFENYGDHSSSGYVKGRPLWDNNEYDLPAACLVHFARTGDRAALRLGLASAQHYLDVDTIHYSSRHAAWARAQHVHSHGLFGHHTAQGPDYNHAGYVQGLIWHSYLTGDPGGIAGARGIADWATRDMPILTGGMERQLGHTLMTCNDVYEATGDEKYLRASAALVDQALKWEHPVRSGFLARIYETPAFYAGSPFSNGVLSNGLIKFNGWARLPEVDAMLVRFARWTLTDCWIAPAALASKGGSPRTGGSPQHIANQGRLMAHVHALTNDPLYLAVPWKLADLGYGANSPPVPGTRSTGRVFNNLPWLLAALRAQGNPEPQPQLAVVVSREPLGLAPGAKATVRLVLENTGRHPIEDLRSSFHSRLDFAIATLEPPPARLLPGQTAECRYEVQAPAQVNLSCGYNRVAYGHWSALYRRGDRAHHAHAAVQVVLQQPE